MWTVWFHLEEMESAFFTLKALLVQDSVQPKKKSLTKYWALSEIKFISFMFELLQVVGLKIHIGLEIFSG